MAVITMPTNQAVALLVSRQHRQSGVLAARQ
jgi:hypothetical protein